MKKLGIVKTGGAFYIVIWHEGDRITIPALGTMIATDTRNMEETIAICKKNLRNFTER